MPTKEYKNSKIVNLKIAAITLLLSFGLAGIVIYQNYAVYLQRDSYGLIGISFLMILVAVLTVHEGFLGKIVLAIPSNLFLLLFLYFIGLGSLSQFLRFITGRPRSFSESLCDAYLFSILALFAWIIGYRIAGLIWGHKLRGCIQEKEIVQWDRKRLRLIATFWGLAGMASMIAFYAFFIGGVPILKGITPNVDHTYGEIISGNGHWLSVIAFNANTFGIIYIGTYLSLFGLNIPLFFIAFLELLLFVGWGPRIYVLIPSMIIGFLYIRKHRPKVVYIMIGMVSVLVLSIIFAAWRNRAHEQYVDLSKESAIETLADLHLAPEFREYLSVLSFREELSIHYTSRNIRNAIVYGMMPNIVWSNVFGIDKNIIFKESSAWIVARITRGNTWTGIRSGLISELVMAYGTFGVGVAFFLLGVIFYFLDSQIRLSTPNSTMTLLAYICAVLLSLLIVGQIESTFSRIWYQLYVFLLMRKFCARLPN